MTTEINMFEALSRISDQTFVGRGTWLVGDLWKLDYNKNGTLQAIYNNLKAEMPDDDEDELFGTTRMSKATEAVALKMKIIRYIIETRKAEDKEARQKASAKAKRKKLAEYALEVKAKKEFSEIEDMTDEELDALINASED